MLNSRQRRVEQFNDGIAIICETKNKAIVKEVARLRFGIRTIGVTRFYQAKISGSNIDKLISVPVNKFVNAKSVILIEDEQYTVKQLQEKMDTVPPTVYITLLKAAPQYEDRRSLNESS